METVVVGVLVVVEGHLESTAYMKEEANMEISKGSLKAQQLVISMNDPDNSSIIAVSVSLKKDQKDVYQKETKITTT